jgi:hypothetical protein
MIHKKIVLGPHRVTSTRTLASGTEAWFFFVVCGSRLVIVLLFENLVDIDFLHTFAGDAKGVLHSLGECVSLVVDHSGAINL